MLRKWWCRKINAFRAWNMANPETLKNYPNQGDWSDYDEWEEV